MQHTKADITGSPMLALLEDHQSDPEFQVAPMVDILLVLLLFFMATATTEVIRRDADISLPTAAFSDEILQNWLNTEIEITEPGVLTVRDGLAEPLTFTSESALTEHIASTRTKTQSMPAYSEESPYHITIRADRTLHFEQIGTVLLACKNAGVQDVRFAVQKQSD